MRLIPFEGLKAKGLPHSKVTVWRLERDGKFPKRVQVSPGRVAWVEAEIDQHIADLVADRDRRAAA